MNEKDKTANTYREAMKPRTGKDVIQEALEKTQRDVEGEFPEGRLNDEDEGALMVAVVVQDGKVAIRFPHPVQWFAMEPEQAVEMAVAMIKNARRAGFKQPVTL
jgi:hypothetical protein